MKLVYDFNETSTECLENLFILPLNSLCLPCIHFLICRYLPLPLPFYFTGHSEQLTFAMVRVESTGNMQNYTHRTDSQGTVRSNDLTLTKRDLNRGLHLEHRRTG